MRLLGTLAILASTLSTAALAQTPGSTGVILVAHGAGPEWNGLIRRVAGEVRFQGPVEVSFLMGAEAGTTAIPDIVDRYKAKGIRRIVVVPLLVSSHSEHYQQIRYFAGLTDSLDMALHAHMGHGREMKRASFDGQIHVTPGLDDSPELARILSERAKAMLTEPSKEAVFLVGHGPNTAEDYASWMKNLRPVADSVRARLGVADVRVDLVRDDAPAHVRAEAVTRVRELIELQYRITGRPVVVVPVLLSRGRISREQFLQDLVGLPVVYRGDPVLPHDLVSTWVERRVTGAASAMTVAPR